METANWKTYTDSDWKISFKYPKDWFIFARGTAGVGDTIAVASFDIESMQQKGNDQTRLRINIYRDKTDQASVEAVVYVIKDGYVYSFTASPSDSNFISTFDQILSTFKFIP